MQIGRRGLAWRHSGEERAHQATMNIARFVPSFGAARLRCVFSGATVPVLYVVMVTVKFGVKRLTYLPRRGLRPQNLPTYLPTHLPTHLPTTTYLPTVACPYKSIEHGPGTLYSLPTAPLVLALPFRAAENRRAEKGERPRAAPGAMATPTLKLGMPVAAFSTSPARHVWRQIVDGSNLALRRSPPARGGPTYLPTCPARPAAAKPTYLPTYLSVTIPT